MALQFYGQFDPPVDRFIFERYFPDVGIKGVFVECGAFDGLTECSCKFFEESMGWKAFNIEPVPWIFQQLCANRPNSVNINRALSNKSGKATFQAVQHPHSGVDCTNGSLQHTEGHKAILDELGCKLVPVEVELFTWNDFVRENAVERVDLLVLDVEGHELLVIEGMHGCAVLPDVICVEVGHLGSVQVVTALQALGYSYDISSHVNAFFVRNDRLPLFSMRASAGRDEVVRKEMADAVVSLQAENTRLMRKIEELVWLNQSRNQGVISRVLRFLRSAGGRR